MGAEESSGSPAQGPNLIVVHHAAITQPRRIYTDGRRHRRHQRTEYACTDNRRRDAEGQER